MINIKISKFMGGDKYQSKKSSLKSTIIYSAHRVGFDKSESVCSLHSKQLIADKDKALEVLSYIDEIEVDFEDYHESQLSSSFNSSNHSRYNRTVNVKHFYL